MGDRFKKGLFFCLAPLLCLLALLLSTASADRAAFYGTDGGMTVTFFDVGQADAALFQVDGKAMLVDGGNTADSRFIVSALEQRGVTHLDVVVCTHGHEDHVGGLAAALSRCTSEHVLSPVKAYDSKAFSDFTRYAKRNGCDLEVPKANTSFRLGRATVTVLAPRDLTLTGNDSSIVLRVEYGATSFLMTGDAGYDVEQALLDADAPLAATVLKVSHHGSDSATSYRFLRTVMPSFAVISVGADNSYGFPDEAVTSRLSDAEVLVYRTDRCGTITCHSDGREVTFRTEKNPQAVQETANAIPPVPEDAVYIGNIGSMKFHTLTCASLPAGKNRVYFISREAAVTAGYTPCGSCKP